MSRSPGPLTPRELLLVVVMAAALSVYFTWPMALTPGGVGRLGLGDGQFSVWNVAWVAHALITPGTKLFDANIFYPHPTTLAFSEPNIGAGLLAVPAYWWTGNPYTAHNSAVLIALTFSVIGMYLLVRRLTGSREGAVVASVLFAFCPFLFARTAHIQLMMMAPMPFALLAFHRFADRITPGRAIVLGLAIGVQALFCSYYGVLVGLLVGLGVLVYAVVGGLWRDPRWWSWAIVAALISGLTVLPVFLPYLELQNETGFGRELDEARHYSADWRAYFASSAWAHRWMHPLLERWNEVLFPGFLALILGSYGMYAAFARRQPPAEDARALTRAAAIFYLLIFVLALWVSFGPQAGLYSLLYHVIPVFSLLRAPARFGLAVSLALAVFSGVAVAVLLDRVKVSSRWLATAALVTVAIAELSTTIPYLPARSVPRAYKVLAVSPRGPVVEFPFYHQPQDRFRHTMYMLGSTTHWMPLVNGYSDFIPAEFVDGAPRLQSFPSAEGFAWLKARDVRYVVFHLNLYDPERRKALLQRIDEHSQHLRPKWVLGVVYLYEIVSWPEATP